MLKFYGIEYMYENLSQEELLVLADYYASKLESLILTWFPKEGTELI